MKSILINFRPQGAAFRVTARCRLMDGEYGLGLVMYGQMDSPAMIRPHSQQAE
ncbi:MAG: hypothetical protein IJT30_06070 [Muribaculaceae bacterium]|nr:hypothetical protein [Muribaculaceae bacterium]